MVDKTSDCWLWAGGKDGSGYGLFKMGTKGRTIGAHQFSYEQTHGPVPKGLFVCHHCDNPSCVHPDHLFLDTCANSNPARGEAASNAKLTEDDVRAIRAAPGGWGKNKELAIRYGVEARAIWSIRANKTWKHVT